MSESDASRAFERHATSKISQAADLFAIRTLGFRGEALASIAAVAEVVLKTRRVEDELGTEVQISGSEIRSSKPVSSPAGSNFMVKNLFFNVPARRKFLKAPTTEFRHIVNEFYRIVLCNPDISFSLSHNESQVFNLPPAQIKSRIINVFGKNRNQVLIPIKNITSILSIHGYIGKPEAAKKSSGEQFFFVNNRYMRHPYFHKALVSAYEGVLPPDTLPSYFLYFEAPTESIDINIHPTKTEVKFEDERSIYQIIHATCREALGKHSLVPSLDFDREGDIDIPVLHKDTEVRMPRENINPDYNPFDAETPGGGYGSKLIERENRANWESLYKDLEEAENTISEAIRESTGKLGDASSILQFKQQYILLAVKSGLMVVDQKRAHERILYEKYLEGMKKKEPLAQQELYPRRIELEASDHALLIEIFNDICGLGFDIRDAGEHSVEIKGVPAELDIGDPREWIRQFLTDYKEREADIKEETGQKVAAAMAKSCAINPGVVLRTEEMRVIMDQLFACSEPGITPAGKAVFRILPLEDFDKMFN
jgi:DNA mismatch repair protein MutL